MRGTVPHGLPHGGERVAHGGRDRCGSTPLIRGSPCAAEQPQTLPRQIGGVLEDREACERSEATPRWPLAAGRQPLKRDDATTGIDSLSRSSTNRASTITSRFVVRVKRAASPRAASLSITSRSSTDRASTITQAGKMRIRPSWSLGRQPTEQVRSHGALRAECRVQRAACRVQRIDQGSVSRSLTDQASTITTAGIALDVTVSAVNRPSKYDHTKAEGGRRNDSTTMINPSPLSRPSTDRASTITSEFPSFRVSEFPSFRVSEFPSFRVSEFPSFRAAWGSTIARELDARRRGRRSDRSLGRQPTEQVQS